MLLFVCVGRRGHLVESYYLKISTTVFPSPSFFFSGHLTLQQTSKNALTSKKVKRGGRWDLHAAVEIHSVNPNRRIILDSQIDVFTDAEPKVARVREVLLAQFVFFHLEAAFEDFFGFGTAHRDVDGDLFVAADAEGSDRVAGFACWDVLILRLV